MTGYIRNDVSDLISNGTTIDAVPLDGEFNAVQSAFAAAGGHKHDGSVGEGAPITVAGPAQDLVVSASSVTPKTDNTLDLGSSSFEFKDLYIDGVANIDSLVADTADVNGGTIDGAIIGATTPAAATFTTVVAAGGLTGNASTASALQTSRTISLTGDVTGTVGFNGTANVSITSTVTANSHDHLLSNITDAGTMAAQDASSVTITGGSVTGITDLAVADGGTGASDAASARTNLGLGTIATQSSSAVSITGGFITGITDLTVADGGTGASTAANARTNLGVAIGTDVQAYDADLAALAALATTGLTVRTGAGTVASRTITAGAGIGVTNGDGVSGNPTIVVSNITTTEIAAATLVTVADTIASNNNDTTIPTSGAAKAYTDSMAIGVGQVWYDNSTLGRVLNTNYQNTTGRPIMVSIRAESAGVHQVSSNAVTWIDVGSSPGSSEQHNSFIVPNNHYYRIQGGAGSISNWAELR